MKWGIIGTGNMGSMLATALTTSGAIQEEDLFVFNRSTEKAQALCQSFENVTVSTDLSKMARVCDVLFMCVKPHDYKKVLEGIATELKEDQCLVSITSPVSVEELEQVVPCQVARIVPSITNHAFAGVSLFTVGTRVSNDYKKALEHAFKQFSTPVAVEEPFIRVSSDIVSCGPAFVSFLLKEWITAAHQVAGISEEQATQLTEQMIVGLGQLISQEIFSLEQLMEKVTVKGGVTGVGLEALENHTGDLFKEMFKATQRKHLEDKQQIDF
ncbi:late competence protein ComER [Halobacillus locisalis]|uniref:Pyrroline-5-carboxylate reductase n=1 Tax=Halobacillus locisalis TaxID=220753 RepID=A0A838CNV8_9BACI|nr:late competence protein ComER [Halobacillus locisalis]MBA2173529.1 late competence protein ComER [Halobacillus locisalis]